MADISNIMKNRSDLSQFLIHLTKDSDIYNLSAKDILKKILSEGNLEAGTTSMGFKHESLKENGVIQNCVCFTETPLGQIKHMLNISGRQCHFKPYGIGFLRAVGREKGINPVWYIDETPGHDWITNYLHKIYEEIAKIYEGKEMDNPMLKITPFIEEMYTKDGFKKKRFKEFWWEREWRSTTKVALPHRLLVICPKIEHREFEEFIKNECGIAYNAVFLDIMSESIDAGKIEKSLSPKIKR